MWVAFPHIGCWLLAVGSWLLAVGCRSIVDGSQIAMATNGDHSTATND
jgi:hypothetical protein